MKPPANDYQESSLGAIGCFTFLYAIALMFIALAWFGSPYGHGLNVVFSRDLIYTTGTVIRFDYDRTSRSSKGRTSTPVVEIPLGKTRLRFNGMGAGNHPFGKGDLVPVAYPPEHPEKAFIRTFAQMYGVPLFMLLIGSFPLALGLWGTIRLIRERLRARR
jgi:hypothetical protein